jgi:acyl-CoA reductase-like NAD-dependent aldehyde dehydrogenase
MGSVKKEMAVFDSEAASEMMKELRVAFGSGKTRSYEWRLSQLKSLLKMAEDREQDIVQALRSDLSKPELESSIYEVLFSLYKYIYIYIHWILLGLIMIHECSVFCFWLFLSRVMFGFYFHVVLFLNLSMYVI